MTGGAVCFFGFMTRGKAGRVRRAVACGLAGLIFGAWMNLQTMVSYGDILFSRAAAAALSNVAAALAIAFDPEWQDLWSLRFEDPLSDAETFAVDDDGLGSVGHLLHESRSASILSLIHISEPTRPY